MTETRKTPTVLLKEALEQAEAELAQLKADIQLTNEIGNREATRHGMCFQWDQIIVEINQATGGRMGFKGRTSAFDVTVTLRFDNVQVPNVDSDIDHFDDWVKLHVTDPIIKRISGHLPGVVHDGFGAEAKAVYKG